MQAHVSQLDKVTHREVPIVWYGIAQQVRLMGDFDGWTQGFSLSANDIHDGTFTKFQATLSLPPVCFSTMCDLCDCFTSYTCSIAVFLVSWTCFHKTFTNSRLAFYSYVVCVL